MSQSVVEFGDELLRTQDLDPAYVALYEADLDYSTLCRLCLAYWCLYHLGAAAKLAEIEPHKLFWQKLGEAAANVSNADGTKPWPRGSERRHFRGSQAIDAVAELVRKYKTAEHAIEGFTGITTAGTKPKTTFADVSFKVQSHRGFGPWIAFKIADMTERVFGVNVNFDDCQLSMYDDPRQGAALVWVQDNYSAETLDSMAAPWNTPITDGQVKGIVDKYVKHWRDKKAKAPPNKNRLVNIQEIETILCKYKSSVKGHYPVGKDTFEIHHALNGWGDLAAELQRFLTPLKSKHKEMLRD